MSLEESYVFYCIRGRYTYLLFLYTELLSKSVMIRLNFIDLAFSSIEWLAAPTDFGYFGLCFQFQCKYCIITLIFLTFYFQTR